MDQQQPQEDVPVPASVAGGVVVGHDGSAAADDALRWAAGVCLRRGSPLHVVRVWQPVTESGAAPAALLRELTADVAGTGLDPRVQVTCHVAPGEPAAVLVATSARADMLVVGARGLGGFDGLLVGSVSDRCVRRAACPVTVVTWRSRSGFVVRPGAPERGPRVVLS
ncbi:universal stress protein [Modestobacter sp. I12A-02628]|uniref:Universal stress protein n=1 Tax=Goekera deserti TaxID=2497753 RepID=A0A7K3WIQ5_9ACTN|nr:universal stress protein [Goekera deserti]MPQ97061.1 universal stress protein [Goekera deserti]NDI46622.1 universal stress protein [Goekera deserti]NEL56378.1 universal stress protein [Goekera deserti]